MLVLARGFTFLMMMVQPLELPFLVRVLSCCQIMPFLLLPFQEVRSMRVPLAVLPMVQQEAPLRSVQLLMVWVPTVLMIYL